MKNPYILPKHRPHTGEGHGSTPLLTFRLDPQVSYSCHGSKAKPFFNLKMVLIVLWMNLKTVTNLVRDALEAGDETSLSEALNQNQKLLEQIGVSSSSLTDLTQKALHNGALAAKITGAGGGGAVLCYLGQDDIEAKKIEENVRLLCKEPIITRVTI